MRRILYPLGILGLVLVASSGAVGAQSRDVTRPTDGVLDAPANAEWTGVGVGDFNGDGVDDLVFERTVLGRGGQPVGAARQFDVLVGPFGAAAKGTTEAQRYRPAPTTTLSMQTTVGAPFSVADVNQDGTDDLVLVAIDHSLAVERIKIAITRGRSAFASSYDLSGGRAEIVVEDRRGLIESRQQPSDVTVRFGDVNGDGHTDLVLATDPPDPRRTDQPAKTSSDIRIMFGDGAWGAKQDFREDVTITRLGRCYSSLVGVTDVTGDGIDDIVAKSCMAGGVVGRISMIAGRAEWPSDMDMVRDPVWRVRTDWATGNVQPNYFVRDVNSDGVGDIAFSLEGTTHVWYGGPDLLRHQSLSRSSRVFLNAAFGTVEYTRAWRPADLDGDGENDLMLARFDAASAQRNQSSFGSLGGQPIYVYEGGNADVELLDVTRVPSDAVWNDPTLVLWGVGDFNGDGFDDILFGGRSVQDFFYPFVFGPLVK